MVELLLPLFMGLYSPEEPVVYEVVSQTGDSITLKLSDSRKSDSPSTVSLPKTLS